MTNPVANDNLSTHLGVKERKVDTSARSAANNGAPREDAGADKGRQPAAEPDVMRASERLAQLNTAAEDLRITSIEEARARVARLQVDIAGDPSAVLSAFGRISPDGIAAAFAEPSG